ncbi:uncharacterized protein LOC132725051 [Ruditapes philippinarum]|uniref:uncharacterized protein LOC132725051 n=1 Tax=Ruditapes philippinarum TaxID=129788 RepID=UPI00295BB011|nr:uncharacterized protein LOC132725051 [Ruditapes philippinarum]
MAEPGHKQSDLSESVLKSSAEDFDHKCVPCLSSDKQIVEATGFCVTCQEFLCRECFNFHKKTKVLKHHELLDGGNMPRGSPPYTKEHIRSIPEIFTQRCSTHNNEFIKFFCPMHETVGCTVCMTIGHKTCKIDYIPENCTGIAESVEYSNVIQKLDKKVKDTDAVLIKAGHRDKFLDLQYDNFITEVTKYRKRIDNRLDELQEKVIEIAGKRRSQDKKAIEEVIGNCNDTSSEAKKTRSSLQDNKASKQNIQLYINIKQAESNLKTDNIQQDEQSLDKINVQYKFQHNEDLEKMIGNLNAFGKISFPSNLSNKEIYSNCLTYVDKINIRTDSDKAFFKCHVIGCAVLSSNKIVLIDSFHNQKLKVVDTDSKTVIEEKVMDAPPAGITAIPNDQIAVIIPKKEKILIMSVLHNFMLHHYSTPIYDPDGSIDFCLLLRPFVLNVFFIISVT